MAFCWNSPKFAEIRRMFAEHPPNIRRIPVRHNSHSQKFAEVRRIVVPPSRCAEEPRRDSQKIAELRRNSPDSGEVQSDSPNIRRIFAGHPPNIRRMSPTQAGPSGDSPKFAEIRRICSFLTLRRLQIRRNSPNIRRNSPNVHWPKRPDRPDSPNSPKFAKRLKSP